MSNQDSSNSYGNTRKWNGGDNNVICDVCGRKRKRSECIMSYGSGTIPVVMACRDKCADYNHPLNYPPPIIFDGRPVRDARPEQTNVFINTKIPALFTWGHFPGGNWGNFNQGNSEFNMNPLWTWGNF